MRRGERFDAVTDQTSAHDELGGYVPGRARARGRAALRAADPAEYIRRSMASMADHVRAMLAFQAAGAVTFDYGNNIRAQAQKRGRGRTPSTSRASCRRSSGRCSARAGALPLGGAVRRSGGHPPHGRGDPGPLPGRRRRWRAGSRWPRSGCPSRACRRASAGWATASARRAGPRLQRAGAQRGGERAHRHRPRPPRRGSVASPNRETEAMRDGIGRRGGLAAAQRAGQHGGRRHLGEHPPRRRRGHRLQPARGHGGRRGRHASWPRASWSGCSPPTRAWASCATWTPATSAPSTSPASAASTSRCWTAERRRGPRGDTRRPEWRRADHRRRRGGGRGPTGCAAGRGGTRTGPGGARRHRPAGRLRARSSTA